LKLRGNTSFISLDIILSLIEDKYYREVYILEYVGQQGEETFNASSKSTSGGHLMKDNSMKMHEGYSTV